MVDETCVFSSNSTFVGECESYERSKVREDDLGKSKETPREKESLLGKHESTKEELSIAFLEGDKRGEISENIKEMQSKNSYCLGPPMKSLPSEEVTLLATKLIFPCCCFILCAEFGALNMEVGRKTYQHLYPTNKLLSLYCVLF